MKAHAYTDAIPDFWEVLLFFGRGSLCPLLAMCGRPRIGKGFRGGDTSWSGAAMCPALYEANFVKVVLGKKKSPIEPGVSRWWWNAARWRHNLISGGIMF